MLQIIIFRVHFENQVQLFLHIVKDLFNIEIIIVDLANTPGSPIDTFENIKNKIDSEPFLVFPEQGDNFPTCQVLARNNLAEFTS